jgi:hypothetical protein
MFNTTKGVKPSNGGLSPSPKHELIRRKSGFTLIEKRLAREQGTQEKL